MFKMVSLLLKPIIPNLDLTSDPMAVSILKKKKKKCNLNLTAWNFPVSTNEVICHLSPLHHHFQPPIKERRGNLNIDLALTPQRDNR